MADPRERARKRLQAVNRLTASAAAAAKATGVEAVDIPTRHREPDYLQTLQIEAAADLLERIAQGAATSDAKPTDDQDAQATEPAATTRAASPTRRAEKPAKASKG